MGIQQELITALQQSSSWSSSAYILTYDESGGYFEHVPSPQVDAYGLGIRVPTWVISPFAKPGHLEPTLYEHTSILKLIETVFGLPTLASVNHLFDTSTPGGGNYEAANGQSYGPPAPPRDGLRVQLLQIEDADPIRFDGSDVQLSIVLVGFADLRYRAAALVRADRSGDRVRVLNSLPRNAPAK